MASNSPNVTACAVSCETACGSDDRVRREAELGRGLRLAWWTLGWNVLEGVAAFLAGAGSGSGALLGFGLDSVVESVSGGVMIWRLRAERPGVLQDAIERIEHRARRLIAISLFTLGAWIGFGAVGALVHREVPRGSVLGILITAASLGVMLVLARAKRRVAAAIRSAAMKADAAQSMACFALSLATLAGVALNTFAGWWWADPVAALVVAALVFREGHEAWQGRACASCA